MGSYSVFLMTASKDELRMSNHKALRDRGYTHLLVAGLNPERMQSSDSVDVIKDTKVNDGSPLHRSMPVSCTIYRLSDGMPVALVNTDVYKIDKDYWGRSAIKNTGTISERWQLGPIYSCDLALKAASES